MFQWTQRDESKRWVLESENFPIFASFGRWNNPDENRDNWHVMMPNEDFFLFSTLTEEDVKQHVEKRAIELLLDAIQEIRSH